MVSATQQIRGRIGEGCEGNIQESSRGRAIYHIFCKPSKSLFYSRPRVEHVTGRD